MTAPALVLLAAGLGSRYGGLKQLDPIGPGGAALMDYALHDGWRAGFRSLVLVVRPETAELFEQQVGARYRSRFVVDLVFQRLEDLPPGFAVPPGRTRPWGTTQAVLAASPAVRGGFVVLNADDFYGRDALEAAATFLAGRGSGERRHAVVGFRLDRTASPAGGVNRAVLTAGADGVLTRIEETRELVAAGPGAFQGLRDGSRCQVPADALVSMNLWAFTPAIFPVLQAAFQRFLEARPGATGECNLPDAVQHGIAAGEASVQVLPTASRWCGVTHAADRPWVERELQALVAAGAYPERPWT